MTPSASKIFGFLLLPLLFPTLSRAEGLRTFADFQAYFAANPKATLEETVNRIDPIARELYTLVYASRSALETDLARPRIILFDADGKSIISYASSPDVRGGNEIEMIETDETLSPRFRRIAFTENGPVAEAEPKTCVACHGNPQATAPSRMRLIWDSYPDWPGVYGSFDNGYLMGRSQTGVSKIPDLEFEVAGVKALQATAESNPRLRPLTGFAMKKFGNFPEMNAQINNGIYVLNEVHQIGEIHSLLRAPPTPEVDRVLRKLKTLGNEYEWDFGEGNETELVSAYIESSRRYFEGKVARIRSATDRYGTAADQAMAKRISVGKGPFTVSDTVERQLFAHDAPLHQWRMRELGRDPYGLGANLEINANALSNPLDSMYLFQSIRDLFGYAKTDHLPPYATYFPWIEAAFKPE